MYETCCSYPIIDERKSFNGSMTELKRFLGLIRKPVVTETIMCQLHEIIAFVEKDEKGDHCIVKEAYGKSLHLLNMNIKKNMVSKSIIDCLRKTNCIMLDQKNNRTRCLMMSPSRCSISSDGMNFLPYLATIPKYKESYPELIGVLGIKEDFMASDYISVLKEIDEEFHGEQLDKSHLDMAIALINCIYNTCRHVPHRFNFGKDFLHDFPIPNADGVLCSSTNLCFNNCPWLLAGKDKSRFCHDIIPHPIAQALGLKTIRQDLLQHHRLSIPFGQREKLVTRINTILRAYPFSEDILKEILQNADDSGASMVHFIKDHRHLPDEKVFEDTWKPMQGPALCVYNDKSFT